MSTIDPLEARRRREAAAIGSPGALAGVVVGLAIIALGAAFETRALFAFGEMTAETTEPPLAVFGLAVGVPLLILGFFVHLRSVRRYTGRLLGSPVVGPLPVLLAGAAVGAWWGLSSLPAVDGWWLVPTGLAAAAVLLFAVGTAYRARRRAQQRVLARLVTEGRITAGRIVEISEIDPSSGGLLGPVTVTFTDHAGVDRWVTKSGQWTRAELPATGDPASVIYDPADPSDESRIWVAPEGSTTAADFLRWHS